MPRKPKHLTLREKRDYLAKVLRDPGSEYSNADKFKAIIEDTKLEALQLEREAISAEEATPELESAEAQHLRNLVDMLLNPEQER